MGFKEFEKDVWLIREYLSVWKQVSNVDKSNIEELINHRIESLGDSTLELNFTPIERLTEVVKLRNDLSAEKFFIGTAEVLISNLIQNMMPKHSPKSGPAHEFNGHSLRKYEIESVELGEVALITKTEARKYLRIHPSKPMRCDLVYEQDPDENASWSGFRIAYIRKVLWKPTETKVKIILDDGTEGSEELRLYFRDPKVAGCWIADFRTQTKHLMADNFSRENKPADMMYDMVRVWHERITR